MNFRSHNKNHSTFSINEVKNTLQKRNQENINYETLDRNNKLLRPFGLP